MGYQAGAEKLFPGESPRASLPWPWMRPEDQERHVTEAGECLDCGMTDRPRVPWWLLCSYCAELRRIRRAAE